MSLLDALGPSLTEFSSMTSSSPTPALPGVTLGSTNLTQTVGVLGQDISGTWAALSSAAQRQLQSVRLFYVQARLGGARYWGELFPEIPGLITLTDGARQASVVVQAVATSESQVTVSITPVGAAPLDLEVLVCIGVGGTPVAGGGTEPASQSIGFVGVGGDTSTPAQAVVFTVGQPSGSSGPTMVQLSTGASGSIPVRAGTATGPMVPRANQAASGLLPVLSGPLWTVDISQASATALANAALVLAAAGKKALSGPLTLSLASPAPSVTSVSLKAAEPLTASLRLGLLTKVDNPSGAAFTRPTDLGATVTRLPATCTFVSDPAGPHLSWTADTESEEFDVAMTHRAIRELNPPAGYDGGERLELAAPTVPTTAEFDVGFGGPGGSSYELKTSTPWPEVSFAMDAVGLRSAGWRGGLRLFGRTMPTRLTAAVQTKNLVHLFVDVTSNASAPLGGAIVVLSGDPAAFGTLPGLVGEPPVPRAQVDVQVRSASTIEAGPDLLQVCLSGVWKVHLALNEGLSTDEGRTHVAFQLDNDSTFGGLVPSTHAARQARVLIAVDDWALDLSGALPESGDVSGRLATAEQAVSFSTPGGVKNLAVTYRSTKPLLGSDAGVADPSNLVVRRIDLAIPALAPLTVQHLPGGNGTPTFDIGTLGIAPTKPVDVEIRTSRDLSPWPAGLAQPSFAQGLWVLTGEASVARQRLTVEGTTFVRVQRPVGRLALRLKGLEEVNAAPQSPLETVITTRTTDELVTEMILQQVKKDGTPDADSILTVSVPMPTTLTLSQTRGANVTHPDVYRIRQLGKPIDVHADLRYRQGFDPTGLRPLRRAVVDVGVPPLAELTIGTQWFSDDAHSTSGLYSAVGMRAPELSGSLRMRAGRVDPASRNRDWANPPALPGDRLVAVSTALYPRTRPVYYPRPDTAQEWDELATQLDAFGELALHTPAGVGNVGQATVVILQSPRRAPLRVLSTARQDPDDIATRTAARVELHEAPERLTVAMGGGKLLEQYATRIWLGADQAIGKLDVITEDAPDGIEPRTITRIEVGALPAVVEFLDDPVDPHWIDPRCNKQASCPDAFTQLKASAPIGQAWLHKLTLAEGGAQNTTELELVLPGFLWISGGILITPLSETNNSMLWPWDDASRTWPQSGLRVLVSDPMTVTGTIASCQGFSWEPKTDGARTIDLFDEGGRIWTKTEIDRFEIHPDPQPDATSLYARTTHDLALTTAAEPVYHVPSDGGKLDGYTRLSRAAVSVRTYAKFRMQIRSYLARSHYDQLDPAKMTWLETTRLQFRDFHGDWAVWTEHKRPKIVLNPASWIAQGSAVDLPQFHFDQQAPWSGDWYLNAVEAVPFGQDATYGTVSGGTSNAFVGTVFANSADPLY